MSIVKKFKDFFNPKVNTSKKESERDKIKHDINLGVINDLDSIREEIGYLLHDFRDLGFEVEIFNDHRKFFAKQNVIHRYLHISIVITNRNANELDENAIKSALCELKFRMDDIPNAEIDKCDYKGIYFNYLGDKIVNGSNIYFGSANTVDQAMSSDHLFKVKILKGPKIKRLAKFEINIYTKPIIINNE